jgi:hypothetical protein
MDHDIEITDAYLAKWDLFARGEKSLMRALNQEGPAFRAALGRALNAEDRRAPAGLFGRRPGRRRHSRRFRPREGGGGPARTALPGRRGEGG